MGLRHQSTIRKWLPFVVILFLITHFIKLDTRLIGTVLTVTSYIRAGGATNTISTDPAVYYSLDTVKTQYNDTFVIYNPQLCTEPNVDVLIIVPTPASNVKARDAIRKTYGTLSCDRTYSIGGNKTELVVRVLFVFGNPKSEEGRTLITKEHEMYKDVLLIDFAESYYHLTRKMINSFRWVDKFCTNVTYVIKADDDVFINVPLLLNKVKTLSTESGSSPIMFGKRIFPCKVQRTGKFALSFESYPLFKYPGYISGTSYTLSGNLMEPIVHYAQFFPYVNIEDAFITGIICNTVLGVKLQHSDLSSRYFDLKPDECEFVATGRISHSSVDAETMFLIWDALQDFKKHCSGRPLVNSANGTTLQKLTIA